MLKKRKKEKEEDRSRIEIMEDKRIMKEFKGEDLERIGIERRGDIGMRKKVIRKDLMEIENIMEKENERLNMRIMERRIVLKKERIEDINEDRGRIYIGIEFKEDIERVKWERILRKNMKKKKIIMKEVMGWKINLRRFKKINRIFGGRKEGIMKDKEKRMIEIEERKEIRWRVKIRIFIVRILKKKLRKDLKRC